MKIKIIFRIKLFNIFEVYVSKEKIRQNFTDFLKCKFTSIQKISTDNSEKCCVLVFLKNYKAF